MNMKTKQKLRAAQKLENFAALREKFAAAGWSDEELTISVVKANVQACALAAPFWALFLVLFAHRASLRISFDLVETVLFCLLYIASIPVHEGLHGLFWRMSCEHGWKSIQFGVMEMLTPYCHCMEPLKKARYLLGAFAPLVLLGLLPSILAVFSANVFLLWFGLFGIVSAGGDMAIGMLLLKSKADLFLDHPTKCGFLAVYQEN